MQGFTINHCYLYVARGLLLAFLMMVNINPALAVELSHEDQAVLDLITNRMNSLTTLEAGFVQSSPDTPIQEGRIFIKRPGKFRIAYESGNLLISNGKILQYVDQELKEVQQVFVSGTPAEILVRPELRFDGDIRVLGIQKNDQRIAVDITQTEAGDQGTATLFFDAENYLLQGWKVVDALENQVIFELSDHNLGNPLVERLFVFFPPPGWRK